MMDEFGDVLFVRLALRLGRDDGRRGGFEGRGREEGGSSRFGRLEAGTFELGELAVEEEELAHRLRCSNVGGLLFEWESDSRRRSRFGRGRDAAELRSRRSAPHDSPRVGEEPTGPALNFRLRRRATPGVAERDGAGEADESRGAAHGRSARCRDSLIRETHCLR